MHVLSVRLRVIVILFIEREEPHPDKMMEVIPSWSSQISAGLPSSILYPFHFEDTGISAACFVTEDSEELNLF